VDFEHFGLATRFSAFTGSRRLAALRAGTDNYVLSGRIYRAWGFWRLVFELGIDVWAGLFSRRFEPGAGTGPLDACTAGGPRVALGCDLGVGSFRAIEVAAETCCRCINLTQASAPPPARSPSPELTFRGDGGDYRLNLSIERLT
jgi:hypothetical protein